MGQLAVAEAVEVADNDDVRLELLPVLIPLPAVSAQSTSRTRRSKGKACPHLAANLKESYTAADRRKSVQVEVVSLSPDGTSQEEAGSCPVVDAAAAMVAFDS
jgi:hypothetical protein